MSELGIPFLRQSDNKILKNNKKNRCQNAAPEQKNTSEK